MPTETILHVALPHDWDHALKNGSYTCASLLTEGFIHACTPEQLNGVLERYFNNSYPVWLLRIECQGLDVRWEQSSHGIFPHIYESIPISQVIECKEVANLGVH